MTPARFNFARDVVERADPAALALRFVDAGGGVRDLTFGEVAEQAARWTALLRRRGLGRATACSSSSGRRRSGTR